MEPNSWNVWQSKRRIFILSILLQGLKKKLISFSWLGHVINTLKSFPELCGFQIRQKTFLKIQKENIDNFVVCISQEIRQNKTKTKRPFPFQVCQWGSWCRWSGYNWKREWHASWNICGENVQVRAVRKHCWCVLWPIKILVTDSLIDSLIDWLLH